MLCSIFQRYKSKAIHNAYRSAVNCCNVVFNISKIQIESNSQPVGTLHPGPGRCVQYFKDTNRKQFTTLENVKMTKKWLCSIFQRYKSKAIHNSLYVGINNNFVVFNISKIQIESNSQR